MSRELLSAWFGVPAEDWPPNHYRLLGLNIGEADLGLIEQRVQQRISEIRRYQVKHQEAAEEALNRLAQAFVCLTDTTQKKQYDATLNPIPTPELMPTGSRAKEVTLPLPTEPMDEPTIPHAWLFTPGETGPGAPLAVLVEAPPAAVVVPPPPGVMDEVVQAARNSRQARQGLALRQMLFQRIVRTRQLLRSWHALGHYLEDEARQLTRPQAREMYRLIERIEIELHDFPLMGEVGQPGYLIVTLARLDKSKTLVNLAPTQRESLSRDWKSGLKFLRAHREFLREEVQSHRLRPWWEGTTRTVREILNNQPLAALMVLGSLTALGIAVWRVLN